MFAIRYSTTGTFYRGMTNIGPRYGGTIADALKFHSHVDAVEETDSHSIGFVMADVINTERDCCSTNHRPTTPVAETFKCAVCGFCFCGACEGSDNGSDLCDVCEAERAEAA